MGYPMLGDSVATDNSDFVNGWVLPGVNTTLFHRLNNLRTEEANTLTTVYLPALAAQEAGLLAAQTNMGTDQAAVWTRNKNEVSDRSAHFNRTRRDMCAFLGFAPGPGLGRGGNQVSRT